MNCLTEVLVKCKLRVSGAGWRSRRPERSSETFVKNTDNTKVLKKHSGNLYHLYNPHTNHTQWHLTKK